MARERLIDTRDLAPPEPFQRVMAAVAELTSGEYIRMVHRRLPYPLLASLAGIDFCHRVAAAAEPRCEILIWRRGDSEAEACCGPGDAPPTGVTPGRCP